MSHVESCHDKSNHVARSMSTWTSEKSHAISIKSSISAQTLATYIKKIVKMEVFTFEILGLIMKFADDP